VYQVYAHIDEPSAEYFLRTRFSSDHASMDRMTSSLSDPTFVSAQCAAARTRLQVVESLLKDNKGGFLMGDEPTHADACLFGWYAFSRLNGDVVKGVWEHESLPMVGEWVERLVQRLVKREELF